MRGITEERAEKSVRFLVETDEEAAALKTETKRLEFKARAIRDAIFLRAEGSVAERTAYAGASDEYRAAMDDHFSCMHRDEAMTNKRKTEALVVDFWRSVNTNRRMGNV